VGRKEIPCPSRWQSWLPALAAVVSPAPPGSAAARLAEPGISEPKFAQYCLKLALVLPALNRATSLLSSGVAGAKYGQSENRMNATEILANAAKVVEKARGWSNEQKLQAASEILHVLKRESHLSLEPGEWEFVASQGGGFLRGPSPLGNSDWAITAGY
jgi:hypothetical protein